MEWLRTRESNLVSLAPEKKGASADLTALMLVAIRPGPRGRAGLSR